MTTQHSNASENDQTEDQRTSGDIAVALWQKCLRLGMPESYTDLRDMELWLENHEAKAQKRQAQLRNSLLGNWNETAERVVNLSGAISLATVRIINEQKEVR
jgi:hypothetical protein